tara:strand:+ start:224 stop:394 length:171 start_codon:yes stop_codon:yes gene_type:complete
MNFDELVTAMSLIAILFLILPSFISTNSKKKLFFKNLSIWGVIVLAVVILSFIVLK